ncbi:transcription initiation factor tfiid-like protein [Thermochaetoides thermophila DSM 1495]|uniref:Transcription initiation factor tfiid-like protein n=1 Tax=Chaetomium thermophilum (strain DSM 1495 / CBS 144.50 / IMI 039719) TaxID=759272 RepID=G0SBW3_CHATD|nr:transcription initiation factor tfiid-like protein [Thermochaetoides thermophila DSM 1495]EGS18889.1 transcription initiation factor tfiid-like protein [Thermochaetoides thermophila DSM 1495]
MDDDGEIDYSTLNDDDWKEQEARDDEIIKNINEHLATSAASELLSRIEAGEAFDQTGKAEDAIDFEDIDLSEDELPDEEPPSRAKPAAEDTADAADENPPEEEEEDLFGDRPTSRDSNRDIVASPRSISGDGEGEESADEHQAPRESLAELMALNFNLDPPNLASNQDPNIPPPAENLLEAVKQVYPGFEENAILSWNQLLRPKQAEWISKKPAKPPKPLVPTKLSLELDVDQEKLFRIPGPAQVPIRQKIRDAEARGLICLEEPEPIEQADLEVFNIDDDEDSETVGGFTLRDIALVCDDWDSMIRLGDRLPSPQPAPIPEPRLDDNILIKNEVDPDDEDWDRMFLSTNSRVIPQKRRAPPKGLPPIPRFTAPNFDNFEEATAKLGKRVILDMNDPYLLLEDVDSERQAKRRKVQHKMVRMANGRLGRDLTQRFNFSNDAAYEALKENSQSKVRATLYSINIEHSMTAQRLTYPFYRVKLAASDPHSYHRPQFHPKKEAFLPVRFKPPAVKRKKLLKGKRIPEIFQTSADLSMNDNSTAILFEYCEEIPIVLSNHGMGQKIINYYRRSKGTDSRPEKRELGEPYILMPEDRSPFAMVGQVQPGETVPTLHNQMFRAPIFKHTPRNTDFILGRSTTGKNGSTWYIRNIDHLFVVGQTLPSMEVPGPHSRRVTNIAKNRLKMVSYRLLRRSDNVTLSDITKHVADSNESQNRQKLKEFLVFQKDKRNWVLPEGEELMPESEIRSLVRPEDVCLLDAMQVGAHELENGGYEINDAMFKDDEAFDNIGDDLPADALANKMAPWRLTKAFIDASHGKAMIAVHGPGDPTGKGLGVSYIRTSMKGGFLEQLHGPLATSADAIERQRKANGGHMYNVKNQDTLYTESLRDIWERQRKSLEDTTEHDDNDVLAQEDEDDRFNVQSQVPAQSTNLPDGVSQVSQSQASTQNRKKLKIIREIKDENGQTRIVTEIVHDPVVIAQYLKRRRQMEFENIDVYNAKLTGDPEKDELILEKARIEQERLEKNKERRKKREKQKKLQQKMREGGDISILDEDSPEPSTEKVTGTTRKCANCGQVGHIKTNKKLCPLLNGSRPQNQNPDDAASLGSTNAPVAASFISLS